MKVIERNIRESLERDLEKKFVFLAGPRQVGKTTLADQILKKRGGRYLLYDDPEDRAEILKRNYVHHSLVCLDEFHKYPKWKNHIKGVYDKYHHQLQLLLTGSARLDIYQKSGDSLFGRYYLHHLHPFTLGELSKTSLIIPTSPLQTHSQISGLEELLKLGGFPQPFLSQSETEHRRWSASRMHLLIKEDLRDLTQIHLVALVEQLAMLLPGRVGSLFSAKSLAEDLSVGLPTIQQWMGVLEQLYIVFKILPFSKKINRAIVKQPKYYLYDWSQIQDPSARFENLVALHLFKACQVWSDLGLADMRLYFIRDRDRHEVDFLILRDNKPWFLVEVKLSETAWYPALEMYANRLVIPAIQLLATQTPSKQMGQKLLVSADCWLGLLP